MLILPTPFCQALGLAGLLVLSACAQPGRSSDPAPSEGPVATQEPLQDRADDRMPDALLGTYDVDAAACARTTTMSQLAVSPDTLRFYYGYATVDAVTARAGGYDVEATLYQQEGAVEVVPEPATYRIDPTGNGLRLDGEGNVPPQALVRCAAGPALAASGDARSAYTRIADCETIERFEESGGAVQRCPGYDGVPLYVSRGDLRYDVDAGVRNGAFETPGGFNALGETVEWRLRGGRPVAVIVRYEVEGPGGTAAERRSDLAVVKVGGEGAPGCLVGYVPADAEPDQNTAARRLADRDAAGFDCAD